MRIAGVILVGIGLGLLMFAAFNLFPGKKQILSPLPHNEGVKVIIVTPTITQ